MKRRTLFLIGFFFLGIVILFYVFKQRVKRGISYYKSGALKHQVILKDGKPEGKGITYYESGKILSIAYWKDGKEDGPVTFYYENGNVRQKNRYVKGVRCCISEDYREDGSLEQITKLDSSGRIIDYYSYNPDGSRDFRRKTKDPIFIPEGDTLILGETYPTLVRLGNRQYDNIEVIIGDIEDPYIAKKNRPLPKKDSLTAIINIKADSLGLRKISGIVIERSATSDSLDVIPFTHRFYVKSLEN